MCTLACAHLPVPTACYVTSNNTTQIFLHSLVSISTVNAPTFILGSVWLMTSNHHLEWTECCCDTLLSPISCCGCRKDRFGFTVLSTSEGETHFRGLYSNQSGIMICSGSAIAVDRNTYRSILIPADPPTTSPPDTPPPATPDVMWPLPMIQMLMQLVGVQVVLHPHLYTVKTKVHHFVPIHTLFTV